jgi:hypothetical protein
MPFSARKIMKNLILTTLILGFGLYSQDSAAQLFKLTITNASALDPDVLSALQSTLSDIENRINKDLPSTESSERLLEGMANSSVMAGKGIGSDYASRMKVFMIGGGIGVGADLEKDKATDSDLSGLGVQGGIVVGTNLGWLNTKSILGLKTDHLNVYLNYLGYEFDRKLGSDNKNSIAADLKSLGFHVSYDLVPSKGNSIFRWGGVKVHTGYEYNSTKLTFKSKINEEVDTSVPGGEVTGTITGNPAAGIDVATQSIPLEISTNIQLLYFISLYTGVGFDFNLGDGKAGGSLNGEPVNLNNTGAGPNPVVQAEANIEGKGGVSSYLTRGFVGAQLNFPHVNVFVQVDKAFGTELIGATAGLRLLY